jgi:outer membrane autotransporter protein
VGQPTAVFSGAAGLFPFVAKLNGNLGEVKAGFTTEVKRNTHLYANVGYQRTADGDRYAYDGKIGFRYEW